MMNLNDFTPWYAKIFMKIILARFPLNYRLWRAARIFRHGDMNRPAYALDVFRTHYDRVNFSRKGKGFVALELGPGDSLFSAMIARSFNASCTYLVDAGRFIHEGIEGYRIMANFLRHHNLPAPSITGQTSLQDLLQMLDAHYGMEGIQSLRGIADGTVDFVWSQAVLEHVFRDQFMATLQELRRVLRPDGVCSHRVDLKDHLGGGLNHLRFRSSIWESDFMRKSGFYTNRIRYKEMLNQFQKAGFKVKVLKVEKWSQLPVSNDKFSVEFRDLPDEDLLISGFDVLLFPS